MGASVNKVQRRSCSSCFLEEPTPPAFLLPSPAFSFSPFSLPYLCFG